MFHNCIQSVKGTKSPATLVYDAETEQDNIDYFLAAFPKGVLLKAPNIKDTGRSKLLYAIKYCDAKYMAFLQDDDYFYPGRLEVLDKICAQQEFAMLFTPAVFCNNGIPTGSQGLLVKAGEIYITPPSKWVLNVPLAKEVLDSPDVPVGWDHAFAHALLSKGKLAYFDNCPIVYNFSHHNATAALDAAKDAEYLKQVKDYEGGIKYDIQIMEVKVR
jgi:hypothetical protein